MKLTDEEKAMLDGEQGKVAQKGLEFIVRYGEVLGAERLCRVTKAHLFAGAHSYLNAVCGADMKPRIKDPVFLGPARQCLAVAAISGFWGGLEYVC